MALIDLYPTDSRGYWIKCNYGLHSSAGKVFNYSNLRKPGMSALPFQFYLVNHLPPGVSLPPSEIICQRHSPLFFLYTFSTKHPHFSIFEVAVSV